MGKRIFDRFNENKKWLDYFNLNHFECITALVISLITLLITNYLDFYDNFGNFVLPLQNITIYIFQALIGMLGLTLAGLAIIISMIKKESSQKNYKLSVRENLQKTLVSFEFHSFNISISIFIFIFLYFILFSDKELPSYLFFNIIVLITTYFFAFIIFYTVSLIGNCIRVFYINDLYAEIINSEKSIYDEINEIRIDYLIRELIVKYNLTEEQLIMDLEQIIDSTEMPNKLVLKDYVRNYY